MFPDLAVGFAEKMANTFEGRIKELTPDQVSTAIRACAFLQDLFAQARRSIEEELSQGVEAGAFVAKYERLATDLEPVLTTTPWVVTEARTIPHSEPVEQVVSSYRALMDEMLSLHELLAKAVAKAKLPARPVDWKRVQEAETTYARGRDEALPTVTEELMGARVALLRSHHRQRQGLPDRPSPLRHGQGKSRGFYRVRHCVEDASRKDHAAFEKRSVLW